MTDLIRRADAIDAVHKYFVKEIDKTPHEIDEDGFDVYTDMPTVNSLLACNKELSKELKALPSADAVSREEVTEIKNNYINEISELLNKIDALSAEAEQVTSKLKNPCDSLLKSDSDECKEQKSKLESADAVDVAHDIPEYCRWSQTYTNMVQGAMSKASAEAVHGEWIEEEYGDLWVCDQCGFENEYMIKFCPICGARMNKGDDTTGESL